MQSSRQLTALLGLGAAACVGLGLLRILSSGAADGGEPRCVRTRLSPPTSEPRGEEHVRLAEVSTRVPRVARSEAAHPAALSPSSRTLRMSQWQIKGRVVGLDGLPLSGHSVRLGSDAPGVERARSDAGGAFDFSMPARSDVLVSEAPGYVTVAGTRASRGKPGFVAALPARGYSIAVGDAATGLPLTAARVTPVPSDALHQCLEAARAKLAPEAVFIGGTLPSGSTARSGLVAFDALPGPEWIDAVVTRPGYQDQRVSFEATSGAHLSIWLEPIDLVGALSGRVLDADGEPVSSAWVASGKATVRAASDGSFQLSKASVDGADRGPFLDVYHPAHGAVRLALADIATPQINVVLPRAVAPLRLRLLARAESGEWKPVAAARALPVASDGSADFLCPFWRAGQTNADGELELPRAMEGTEMVAYAKGGDALGRFVLNAGDVRLVD